MRRFLIFSMLLIGSAAHAEPTAQATAQHFFAAHFASDMGFTATSVAQKRRWLTPNLRYQIDRYFRRPTSPEIAPAVNGDPFTNAQEYPSKFVVGDVTKSAQQQTVPVIMLGSSTYTVTLILRPRPSGWLIDDFVYPDGTTLRKLLNDDH